MCVGWGCGRGGGGTIKVPTIAAERAASRLKNCLMCNRLPKAAVFAMPFGTALMSRSRCQTQSSRRPAGVRFPALRLRRTMNEVALGRGTTWINPAQIVNPLTPAGVAASAALRGRGAERVAGR